MAAISIRDLPDPLYAQLKARAESHHRSLNKEVLVALTAYVATPLAAPVETAQSRFARVQALLDNAPRIDKESAAYRQTEAEILGEL
jgi:antitoxin FitA